MLSPQRGWRRPRRPRTSRNVFMLCLFALMLLSPVAANASVADQLDAQRDLMAQATETPPEGDQVEPTEEPFVEPTAEPVVEPTEEPFVEPTEEPQGEQVGSVEIEYRECEAGYAFLDGTNEDDLDQMLMECGQVDDVEFTIDEGGPDGDTQLTGEFGDSHVSFTEVPTGMRTVTQTTAFDSTYVVCNGIVQNGGPETGVMEVPVTDGAIEWDLLDEEVAFCNWFVATGAATGTEVPGTETATEQPAGTETATEAAEENLDSQSIPGPGEPRTLAINKFFCPAGADLSNRDPGVLIPICQETPVSVEFTVSDGGGGYSSTQQSSVGDTSGGAIFPDVPAGNSINIIETIPAGYGQPIVICHGQDLEGTIVQPKEDMLFLQGIVYIDNVNVALTLCEWFNVPTQEPAVGNTVYINKHACPATYDASAHDMFDMAANCHEDAGVVNFSVFEYGGGGYDGGIKPTSGGPGPNLVTFTEVPNVKLTIYEEPVAGYTDAVVFCGVEDGLGNDVTPTAYIPAEGGFNTIPVEAPGEGNTVFCDWYNVPPTDSAVTVTKWYCPEGLSYDEDQAYYDVQCTQYHEGVDFKLTHSGGSTFDTTDANGKAEWTGVPLGPFSIQEYIPPQYGEPIVFCGFTAFVDGAIADGFPQRVETANGFYESALELPNTSYFCDWYNVPGEPGEITIYKYTCPEGYDLYAWNANPREDCTDATNGITFRMEGDDYESESDTGDSVDGAVSFGGLEPGPYTVVESVPDSTSYVFVLDCYGQTMGELRPYPLWMGNDFPIDVSSGESIQCYWYNVPDYEEGRLTVYKYWCSTKTYTSDVDCEIYEGGKDFDLVMWDGDSWEKLDTKTTDGGGMITWGGIDPGEYWLDEHDTDWCHMTSEQLSDDGNWLNVSDGEETIVNIYNCGVDPKDPDNSGKPGTPGKTPTKYPNTGAGPEQGPDAPAELPAVAPLAALLALLATRRSHRFGVAAMATNPVGEGLVPSRTFPEAPMDHTLSRRKLAALLTIPLGGTALIRAGILAQADQVIEPIDGTPPGGTPTSLCLPATPSGQGDGQGDGDGDGEGSGQGNGQGDQDESTAGDCLRGPVPVTLRIEAIGVDAPVEILETVGGVMQQPSDEAHVAWYKETARLGELGNLLIAGHLNWWGFPEAVFFGLGTLREGDVVVLLDEEENAYTYEVEWVRQESNLEPPAEEVLGMTAYEAVTLMTCGGQWDSSISEYDERTVARAKRVADGGTPEA